MRQAAVAGALLGVTLGLLGCGGLGGHASPKATFTTLWNAARAGDADAMMACFCKDTRETLAEMKKLAGEMAQVGAPAPEEADVSRRLIADARRAAAPQFGEQTLEGDKATLEVILEVDFRGKKESKKETLQFVQEDGGWKIKLPLPERAELRKEIEKLQKKKSEAAPKKA
jgi:hypothetical protein